MENFTFNVDGINGGGILQGTDADNLITILDAGEGVNDVINPPDQEDPIAINGLDGTNYLLFDDLNLVAGFEDPGEDEATVGVLGQSLLLTADGGGDEDVFALNDIDFLIFDNGILDLSGNLTTPTFFVNSEIGTSDVIDELGGESGFFNVDDPLVFNGSSVADVSEDDSELLTVDGNAVSGDDEIAIVEDGVLQGTAEVNGDATGFEFDVNNTFFQSLSFGETVTVTIDTVISNPGGSSFDQTFTVDVIGDFSNGDDVLSPGNTGTLDDLDGTLDNDQGDLIMPLDLLGGNDFAGTQGGDDVVFGNDGNDQLFLGDDNDVGLGGDGNDIIGGGLGNDLLIGDSAINNDGEDEGEDILANIGAEGDDGSDQIFGGAGDDIIVTGGVDGAEVETDVPNPIGVPVDLGEFDFILPVFNPGIVAVNAVDLTGSLQGINVEDYDFSTPLLELSDIFTGSANDTAFGGDGEDIIIGADGDDVLGAGAGELDFVFGQGGDDVIFGGDGVDYIDGGSGNDTAFGGADTDLIFGDTGDDRLYGGEGFDLLLGGDGDDFLGGGNGTDLLFGGGDDDTINGGNGFDVLYGDDDDDVLNGGAGNDIIIGGDDEDVINGGAGNDLLIAGEFDLLVDDDGVDIADPFEDDEVTDDADTDTFVFQNGHGDDTIRGFENDQDLIDVSALGITSFEELSFLGDSENTIVGTGDGNSIFIEGLNVADLDASDFIFAT